MYQHGFVMFGYNPITVTKIRQNREIIHLQDKENEQGYDYSKQERSGLTKRDSFFQNMRIPRQNWNDIHVDYIYYPLKEKYNL